MRWLILMGLSFIAMASYGATGVDLNTKTYHLNNGLQLIVVRDTRSPIVVSQIWYKVGSAYETPGLSGISHMLEHMMFKGTTRYPNDSMTRLIGESGGTQNAATSRDFTYYYESLPADKLALAFDLEADRMQHLALKKSDFVKENQVVQEERRLRTDDVPTALLFERFNAAAHLSPPYHHPTIGWMHDIQHYTIDDLQKWYHQWYAPNNATLVVVGDVQPSKVYALAKQYFGPIKPNTQLPALKDLREPPALGTREVTVVLPAKVPYVFMGYNVPNFKTANPSWQPYALALTAAILGGGDSARFTEHLVRKQQIAAEVSAYYSPYTLFPGLFVIGATPSEHHPIDEVVQSIQTQIHQLQTQLVSQKELQKVKNQVIAARLFGQDAMSDKATRLGMLASLGLPWQTINTDMDTIQAITPAQIQMVAKRYLVDSRLTVAQLAPLPQPAVKQHTVKG